MGMPAAAAAAAIAADDDAAVEALADVDGPADVPALGSAACVVIRR